MSPAIALLVRDIKLAWREGGAIGVVLGFYLVVVAIMPFGLGPDLNLLARIAPGMLWVALLLAALLSADRIFHNDYEDGTLDVLATGPLPLPLLAADGARARPSAQPAARRHAATGGDHVRRYARGELHRGNRRKPDLGLTA